MTTISNLKKVLILIGAIVIIIFLIVSTAILSLYNNAQENVYNRLTDIVQREKSFTLSLLKDTALSESHIIEHLKTDITLGQYGEIVYLKELNDSIEIFIASKKSIQNIKIQRNISDAAPIRKALNKETGVIKGKDYNGIDVFAAFSYVDELKWGIVAQIETSEVNKPYYTALIIAFILTFVLIVLFIMLLIKTSNPIIARLQQKEKELIKTKETAEESIKKFEAFTDQSIDGVTLTNMNGNYVFVNPAFCQMSGYSKEELLKMSVYDMIVTSDIKDTLLESKSKQDEGHFEVNLMRKDSTQYIAEIVGKTISIDNQNFVLGTIRDISERKRAEQAIKESENQLNLVVDNLPAFVSYVGADDLRYRFVNKKFAESYKLTKNQIVGAHVKDIIGEKNYNFAKKYIELVKQGQHVSFENQYNTAGTIRWLSVNYIPDFNQHGQVIAAVMMAFDLTEIKQTQDSERKIKNQLRAILDHTSAIIYLKDKNYNYLFLNKQYEKMFGIKEEDFIGKSDYDIHPRYIAEQFRTIDQRVFNQKTSITEEEQTDLNGIVNYYLSTKFLLFDTNNEPYAICGISTDITEIKQREAQLRESEEKYRILFEKSDDAILLIEGQTFKDCNNAAVKLFGYENILDLIGVHPSEISPEFQPDGMHSMEKASSKIQETMQNGMAKFEWMHKRANGQVFPAEVWLTLIPFQGRKIIHSIVRDLSERKKAEQDLIESEHKFNSIVANANEGIIIVQDGVYKFANKYATDLLQLPIDEIIGKSFTTDVYPDDLQPLFDIYLKKLLKDDTVTKHNYRYYNVRKEIRWAELSSIYHEWEGKPAVLAFVSDITDRIKIQHELKKSEKKYRAIIQSQAEGIAIVDKNEVFEFVNKAAERVFETENLVGVKLFDFLDDDEIQKINQQSSIRRTGEDSSYDLKITTKKGNKKYIRVTASAKYDENQNYTGAYGIFSDITEQKKAELALLVSEHKFNSIVSNANEAIFVVQDEIIKFANQHTAILTGKDLTGKSILEFIFPDDVNLVVENNKKKLTKLETTSRNIYRFINAKNEIRWAEVNSLFHLWEERPAVLSFLTDITQRIENEQKILQQTEELKTQANALELANTEITKQKNLIERNHRNILSSIHYASLIQKAVLPREEFIAQILPSHFVFYKPRDIVSGDFYFIRQYYNYLLVATVDCTGHGVPGAFMSMLGITLLNELIKKEDIKTSDILLNELREAIKYSLHQTGETGEQQDGMDIAFCAINLDDYNLSYAGANNPCWIVRSNTNKSELENSMEFFELPADRMPVGIYINEKPFTEKTFQLQKGDVMYLFTDGIYSQFGGENNEKYKTKRLKEYLISISHNNLQHQKELIEIEFNNWKGNEGQTDDVLLLGFKI